MTHKYYTDDSKTVLCMKVNVRLFIPIHLSDWVMAMMKVSRRTANKEIAALFIHSGGALLAGDDQYLACSDSHNGPWLRVVSFDEAFELLKVSLEDGVPRQQGPNSLTTINTARSLVVYRNNDGQPISSQGDGDDGSFGIQWGI